MIIFNSLTNFIELYQYKTYTFEDIYNQINDKTIIDKVGNAYEIYKNVRLTENVRLVDKNVSVIVHGEYFRIDKGCELRLGEIDNNGRTSNGCYFRMINPNVAYGFGCKEIVDNKTQSGNLFAYGSVIDAFCFWGFFSGQDQHVEVIDCNVNAFGRVEGTNSVLKNINFTESHPRYGCLSPKGTIKLLENLNSKKSTDCSVYLNPNFVDDMRVVGGTYSGYARLIYSENNPKTQRVFLNFIDSTIIGNTQGKWGSNTGMRMYNTFNPVLVNSEGDVVPSADIVIKNAFGQVQFEGQTDENGQIYVELLTKEFTDSNTEGNFFNPFTVIATKGNDSIQRRFNINKAFKELPLTLSAEGSGVQPCDLTALEQLIREEHAQTQEYMLALQDMTASGTRILAKYGYKPQAFVGDPSYLSLSQDNFITLEEDEAEKLYDRVTFDKENKIIDAGGLNLMELYHVTHLKQIKDVSRTYIYRANNDGSYALLSDWDVVNYVNEPSYIDYRIKNGVKVYSERLVPFDVSLGGMMVGCWIDIKIRNQSNEIVWEKMEDLHENGYHYEVPTDGLYTLEVSIYKEMGGERVYYDNLRLTRAGHRIMARSTNINPEHQEEVVYVNNDSSTVNDVHKEQILSCLPPELAKNIDRYTDLTTDPWSPRGSYDKLMMRCARGEISRIYVWEKEEFGHTRTNFTVDLLNNLGVEVIETRHMISWEQRVETILESGQTGM